MSNHSQLSRPVPVPAGRTVRMGRMGLLAAGIAGRMAAGTMRQLGRGERPVARDLLLTSANLRRVADELARMRGAAMKIGQLVSMDAGDVLTPELADILARLRADADFMPPKQLRDVLDAEWGAGWRRLFARFDVRPVAAASIGQVHRAVLQDGTELAIKVQYPGIARSIDSDVANIGRLIRLSGLLPEGFDLNPYLDEARQQLREEADYEAEAQHLTRFETLLKDDPKFVVPKLCPDLSSSRVLAMRFVRSVPIESLSQASTQQRDTTVKHLCDLALRELFDFCVMQSDPNFANYRYCAENGRIVLLDFGATRTIPEQLARELRHLIKVGLNQDRDAVSETVHQMGLLPNSVAQSYRNRILDMMMMVFDEVSRAPLLDLAQSDLSRRLRLMGEQLARDGFVPPPVPMDVLYVQRKVAGMFLLAQRLQAKVPIAHMLSQYTQHP